MDHDFKGGQFCNIVIHVNCGLNRAEETQILKKAAYVYTAGKEEKKNQARKI